LSTVSDLTEGGRRRRRRSDAERSVTAILDAAARILSENPRAGMGEIADAAGLTRQTVYVHFPSRDAIVKALTDRATDQVTAVLQAADLSRGPAAEALLRLVRISWETFEAQPFLLNMAGPPTDPDSEHERHLPVFGMLKELVDRGRREGDFDPDLPTSWIIAATVALGHAAGEEVRAGRITSAQADAILQDSLRRLFAR